MKMSAQAFRDSECKRITLLGMSGVGKTTLAAKLPKRQWFHYSGDYRIGTHYLNEPILDYLKQQAMRVKSLEALLRSDSIYIRNNITIDNLTVVSHFLGKIGNPAFDGLSLAEFKRRQILHRQAEIASMMDVPQFIEKVAAIYGYQHFLNDAGGSLCELESSEVLATLAQHTLIIYLKTTPELEKTLQERAQADPKPLYYREAFLDEHLAKFMSIKGYQTSNEIIPDEFVSWVFPCLFKSRLPRYQAIAEQYGYTIAAQDMAEIKNEADFIQLVSDTLVAQT
jgi:shikimate kinase